MSTLDLRDELGASFAGACDDLFEARLLLAQKDTSAHRTAVAECRSRIDAVLDLFLEVGRPALR